MRTLAVVTATLALACATPRPTPRPEPFQYRGYFATYPTGLRLVALQTAEVGRATVRISYGIGSADDPPGKEGLARLAVILSDRSAPGRGGFTLGERYFASGAEDESLIHADEVVFRARARLAQLDEALAVEADRLRAPLAGVSEEEFRSARETLARRLELEPGEDTDRAELVEVVRRAFSGTRYGRNRATPATVRAIAFDDVRRWLAEYLVPARAILVVTGAEVPEAVGRRVLASFGPLAATGAPGETRRPPISHGVAAPSPQPDAAGETLTRPKAAPHLWLAWLLPGDRDGQTAAAAAAAAVLQKQLRDHASKLNGAVTGVEVTLERRLEASAAIARVDLREAAAAPWVRDALVAAASGDDVLRRGGEQLANSLRETVGGGGFWRMEDGSVADAGWMVRALGLSGGDPLTVVRTQAQAQMGPPLAAYYREHLRPERARRVLVTAPSAETAEQAGAPVSAKGFVSRASVLEAASPGPDRVRALVEPPGIGQATRHRLSNGLEVRILRRGSLPVVDARLLVDADVPEGPMASVIPFLSLKLSRKEWTPVGDFGCRASPFVTQGEKLAFLERGPAARLDDMLDRLACWTQREVSTEHLDQALEGARRDRRLEATPGYRATSALMLAAYGDPRRALPTQQAVDTVSAGEAKRWLEAQLRPERALLVLVGNVSATPELLAMLEQHLGGWRPGKPPARTGMESPWPSRRRTVIEAFPGSEAAVIGVAVRVPAIRDDAALRALRHLIALRVNEQVIGLDGGSAAAVLGGPSAEPLLQIWLTARTADAPEALKRTLATLERIARTPPRDAEAGMARWMAAREEAFRFDTVKGSADALQEAYFRREPLEGWDALPASLAGVDPDRLHAAARSTSIGREAIAVMGDAVALEPALKAAALAPELLPAPPKVP